MLTAYADNSDHLRPTDIAQADTALWIDLLRPTPDEIALVEALGVEVPSLDEMEEIELSNRIYHEGNTDYMTVVVPGETAVGLRAAMPVTFILTEKRLITVRHHDPQPFATFPDRAGRALLGCQTPDHLFIGLVEEIVGRLADLLEGSQQQLEHFSAGVFGVGESSRLDLQMTLQAIGREAGIMSKVRLGLMSVGRVLAFYSARLEEHDDAERLRAAVKALLRDIQSVEVHAVFLSGRVGLALDATLGMINLQQNATVRILSVMAALFLPPTLIASIYGMNFTLMPELDEAWGYPMSLGLMAASAVATFVLLKWKKWL